MMPLASVILPSYNRASLLPRAVDSVLSQTFDQLELVIVDDCSSDNTESVVRSIADPRVLYLRHDTNRGVAVAQNTGVRAAKGKYIGFIHSDDEWLPTKLERQVAVLEASERPIAGVESARVRKGGNRNTIVPPYVYTLDVHDLLAHKVGVHISPFLFPAETLRAHMFDESLRAWEDWDLLLRIKEDMDFVAVPDALSIVHESAEDRLSTSSSMIEGLERLFLKHHDKISAYPPVLALWHWKFSRYYLRAGEHTQAREHLKRSLTLDMTGLKRSVLLLSTFFGGDFTRHAWRVYEGLGRAVTK